MVEWRILVALMLLIAPWLCAVLVLIMMLDGV